MTDNEKFRESLAIANHLLVNSTRDGLGEALILLATNLAHYQLHYGELNLTDEEATTKEGKPNEKQFTILIEGMAILANVLGTVATNPEQVKH
jgi:hypothetical protein